jgi:hypothetical protein
MRKKWYEEVSDCSGENHNSTIAGGETLMIMATPIIGIGAIFFFGLIGILLGFIPFIIGYYFARLGKKYNHARYCPMCGNLTIPYKKKFMGAGDLKTYYKCAECGKSWHEFWAGGL